MANRDEHQRLKAVVFVITPKKNADGKFTTVDLFFTADDSINVATLFFSDEMIKTGTMINNVSSKNFLSVLLTHTKIYEIEETVDTSTPITPLEIEG